MKNFIVIMMTAVFSMANVLGCSNNNQQNSIPTPIVDEEQNRGINNESIKNNETTNVVTDEVTDEATRDEEVVEVNKNKMVIVLDPGHGGNRNSEKEPVSPGSKTMKRKNVSGTAGINTKTPEPVVNLAVALKLEKYLTEAGYTVILTRSTSSETVSNIERAEIGNDNNADLVLRIHADGSNDSTINGASILVPGNVGYAKDIFEISSEYGKCIIDTLADEVGMKNRGVRIRKDITGFNWSKVPVVLIEMGYMSNPNEDKLLASDSYQEKLAMALYKGIDKALNK